MSLPYTLKSLPLFPLNTVLFPGGLLSLQVFEVRYLDMVRKCQQAGAPFGVVALMQGSEVRKAGAPIEQLEIVGTLAVIDTLASPQPGLLRLHGHGTDRFRIHAKHQLPHGLWTADVELLPPDTAVLIPEELQPAARALQQALHRLLGHDTPSADLVPAPTAIQLEDCGWVANRWCELLPLPPSIRQQMMMLDSPLIRLELVCDVLERTGLIFR